MPQRDKCGSSLLTLRHPSIGRRWKESQPIRLRRQSASQSAQNCWLNRRIGRIGAIAVTKTVKIRKIVNADASRKSRAFGNHTPIRNACQILQFHADRLPPLQVVGVSIQIVVPIYRTPGLPAKAARGIRAISRRTVSRCCWSSAKFSHSFGSSRKS